MLRAKMRWRTGLVAAASAFTVSAASAAPLDEAQRAAVLKYVEKQEPGLAQDSLAIWRLAELGFQETQSTAILQGRLRKAGFTVKSGVAGMPTAFVASLRTGEGPVIGILAEYDALPGLAQAAVPTSSPIAGQAAGHGCGHNLFGAASVDDCRARPGPIKGGHDHRSFRSTNDG